MDDLEMFDLDEPMKKAPPKARKFLPSKFKPKPAAKKEEGSEDSKPAVAANGVLKMEHKPSPSDATATAAVKMESEPYFPDASAAATKMESEPSAAKVEIEAKAEAEVQEEPRVSMEEDDDEDRVVREIDVFFSPHFVTDKSQLYVLQYPLRPCWRPYEIDEQCVVRVNPASSEVEIDLNLDVQSVNYDQNGPIKTTKQTLSSLWKPSRTTGYAVGVLIGDKLHLNPIHAVVQLRPSMQHLKLVGSNKKHIITNTADELIKSEERSEESLLIPKKQSKLKEISSQCDVGKSESWVPLKYYGSESDVRSIYMQKMVARESSPIQFSMSPYDYVSSLCPGSHSNNSVKGPPRRLLSLPLEERIRQWLSEGPPVHRFNALKHLAPDDPVDDLLRVIKERALLVQGTWVLKTRYAREMRSIEALARDYILLLFSKDPIIKSSVVESSRIANVLKSFLKIFAFERPSFKDWKFKEPRDVTFTKLYPDIVKEQEQLWKDIEHGVMASYNEIHKSKVASKNVHNKSVTTTKSGKVPTTSTSETASQMMMSNETSEALPKALKALFENYKVCSFQQICQGLREMAVSQVNSRKPDARILAAAKALDAPKEELQAVIDQHATNIHGVYVLKPSVENSDKDRFRSVIIDLFCVRGSDARLRKAEFMEAYKIAFGQDVNYSEFTKVLQEYCVSRNGAWFLKSGDGSPA